MNDPVSSRAEQLVLAVFTCAAVAAFGSAFNQPAAWVFWIPAIVSPFWQIRSLPPRIVKWARFAPWPLLASAITLGLVLMAYAPLFSPRTTEAMTLISGYGLGLCASVFLLGTRIWNPAETVIPAATGMAVVACFNSLAVITPLLMTPAAAAFVYLLMLKRVQWRQLLSARLVISTLASAMIAFAFYSQLPRLQQQVETLTMRWMSGDANRANPFGIQSQLGDIERLQLSHRIVLRVWTSQAQKLRARVFARFDGRTWQASIAAMTFLQQPAAAARGAWLENVPGTYFVFPRAAAGIPSGAITTRIVESVASSGVLPSPAHKMLVRAPALRLRADGFDNLLLVPSLSSDVPIYGVVNEPGPDATETGAATSPEEFLGIPPGLDPRWSALAAQLSSSAPSVEGRVTRTIDYVKNAAKYSLDVGQFRTQQPITEFFFEKKRGYCQYFATAAAVLLRLQGIPARYVTGYVVQEFNSPGGYYVVRDADAHAWVEVLLPGKGWTEVDPTPEAEFQARRNANSPGRLAEYVEWLAALAAETWVLLSQSDWRDALVTLRQAIKPVLAVGLLLGTFFVVIAIVPWMRRRRRRPLALRPQFSPVKTGVVDPRLLSVRESLDRVWEKAGIRRPPSRGLIEHLNNLSPEKVSAEFLDLSRQLAGQYYHLSFGEQSPASDDLREMERLCAQLGGKLERRTNPTR